MPARSQERTRIPIRTRWSSRGQRDAPARTPLGGHLKAGTGHAHVTLGYGVASRKQRTTLHLRPSTAVRLQHYSLPARVLPSQGN